MKQVSVEEIAKNVSGYLQMARQESVIITRQGVPVGLLVGFEESEDGWEEWLLNHPLFRERIARSRQSLREGKGISIVSVKSRSRSQF